MKYIYDVKNSVLYPIDKPMKVEAVKNYDTKLSCAITMNLSKFDNIESIKNFVKKLIMGKNNISPDYEWKYDIYYDGDDNLDYLKPFAYSIGAYKIDYTYYDFYICEKYYTVLDWKFERIEDAKKFIEECAMCKESVYRLDV